VIEIDELINNLWVSYYMFIPQRNSEQWEEYGGELGSWSFMLVVDERWERMVREDSIKNSV